MIEEAKKCLAVCLQKQSLERERERWHKKAKHQEPMKWKKPETENLFIFLLLHHQMQEISFTLRHHIDWWNYLCVCHTFIWRSFLPLFKVTLSISGNALSAISFPLCGAYGSSHFALFSNTNVAVVILTLEIFFCLMWGVYIFTQKTPPSRCYCCHCIFGWRKIEWDSIIRRRAHYYAPP